MGKNASIPISYMRELMKRIAKKGHRNDENNLVKETIDNEWKNQKN